MRCAVALDLGLEDFEWLLRRAVVFATRAGARLDLLYVGDLELRRPKLEALRDEVPPRVRGEARRLTGDPTDALIAESAHYDLLVIGPREPSGIERWFHEPMALRVLRRSRCPVYVPRTDRFGPQRPRLLVGVDLRSDRLEFVLEQAQRWARALDGTVDLLHAMPRSTPPFQRPELREALHREWDASHRSLLQRLQALLEAHVDRALRGKVRLTPGEAEDALVDGSDHYDLLLVGNRDRRGLERLLLGSVARVVVLRARCDVLVLPTGTAIGGGHEAPEPPDAA